MDESRLSTRNVEVDDNEGVKVHVAVDVNVWVEVNVEVNIKVDVGRR